MKNNDQEASKHNIAMNLVLKCGVPPKFTGYNYLTKAVEICANGENKATNIYKEIAKGENILYKSVARDITYAITKSFDLCKSLSEIVGVNIPPEQIHSGLVITYLAAELNNRYNDTK